MAALPPIPETRQRSLAGAGLPSMRRLWSSTDAFQKAAFIIGILMLVMALLAPLIAPFHPDAQNLLARFSAPVGFGADNPEHLLGTDELGRDVLSRSLHALQLTLGLAFLGAIIGLVLGGGLGLLAGIAGGRIEAGVMAAVDAQIAVPFTLIALFVLGFFGTSLEVLVVVLGLNGWEQYARIVRAEVRRLMGMPFIEAARAAGAGPGRIARTHVLPNIVSPLVVQFTLSLTAIILLESTLSFLGLGVQPPTATLGAMVGIGRDYMSSSPWIVLTPALLILLVTFAVQILGDWLRDQVDVRLRAR